MDTKKTRALWARKETLTDIYGRKTANRRDKNAKIQAIRKVTNNGTGEQKERDRQLAVAHRPGADLINWQITPLGTHGHQIA